MSPTRGPADMQQLDILYQYMKANPDKCADVEAAISAQLTPTIQTYVHRMLDKRKQDDNPCKLFPLQAGPALTAQHRHTLVRTHLHRVHHPGNPSDARRPLQSTSPHR